MTCQFDHEDPIRVPHRCAADCAWTPKQALEHMQTQPILFPSMLVRRMQAEPTAMFRKHLLPNPINGVYPAHFVVPKFVQRNAVR